MPYGKGTYGKKVGRPPKKKLYPKEYQRLKDQSPKTGATLDKAVQRVEGLKATSRAHKKAKREKARDIVNAKFLPDKPTSPTYNPTIPAWSHKLRAERASRAKRARRSSR